MWKIIIKETEKRKGKQEGRESKKGREHRFLTKHKGTLDSKKANI